MTASTVYKIAPQALWTAAESAGRFDGAQVRIGLVDWENGDHDVLYAGTIGTITEEEGRFAGSVDLVAVAATRANREASQPCHSCGARL
jgi:hypothetical protein